MICDLIDLHHQFNLPVLIIGTVNSSEIQKKYLKYKKKYLELVNTR